VRKVKNWVDLGRGALDGGALPPVPTPFHDRWRELAAIKQKLEPGARVVLYADSNVRAGVGRTVLLRQVAHQTASTFPGGVYWWDLELDGRRPQPAFHRWGRQLQSPAPPIMSLDAVTEVLRDVMSIRASRVGPMLIAIDGVDDSALDAVERVLEMIPEGSGVLLSAESPSVAEAIGGELIEVKPLQVVEGLGLLRVAAGKSLPQNAAVSILEAVDHLPLGIRLVGYRYAIAPPADPAKLVELPDEIAFDAKLVGRLPGNGAVARVFYTMYAGLSPQGQRAFRWCGCMSSARVHARDVAGVALLHYEDVARELEVLGTTGLLQPGSDPSTWLLHPMVRAYARVLLRVEGEHNEARSRHLSHFLSVVLEHADDSPRDHMELLRLAPEINAAIRYALGQDQGEVCMQLADVLVGSGAWFVGGYLEEAAGLLKAAIEATRGSKGAQHQSYQKMMMELIRIAPRAVQAAGELGRPQERPQRMDSAQLEEARHEAIAQAQNAALEAEGFVAQARVWIDGGRADAGEHASQAVRDLLERLDDIGADVSRLADDAAKAVGRVEQARGVSAMDKALGEARGARDRAERLATEAEEVWAQLQETLADVDAAQASADAVLDRIRQEVEISRRVLEDARDRVQDQRSALPNGVTSAVRSTWAEVTRAMGSATAAVEAADSALRQARTGDAGAADVALELAQSKREEVELATQDALEAAVRALRVARAAEGDSAVGEVRDLAEKSDAAARRFERVQRKIAGLLESNASDPEAADVLERLHQLYQDVLDQVEAVRSAVEGVSHASSDASRRRIHRGAVTASREVSARAGRAVAAPEGRVDRRAHRPGGAGRGDARAAERRSRARPGAQGHRRRHAPSHRGPPCSRRGRGCRRRGRRAPGAGAGAGVARWRLRRRP
jgi:hypothetical protein